MRGSPPERFTGKSGLSRVLLVADVLGLGGVEGQVADGSHDLVDSEGHDCEQDVLEEGWRQAEAEDDLQRAVDQEGRL